MKRDDILTKEEALVWVKQQLIRRHDKQIEVTIDPQNDSIMVGQIRMVIPFFRLFEEVDERTHPHGLIELEVDRLWTILRYVETMSHLRSPYETKPEPTEPSPDLRPHGYRTGSEE
jgi:hypothetical protein